MNTTRIFVFLAAILCTIAVAMTETSVWFLVPVALAVGILAGYDIRKKVESS